MKKPIKKNPEFLKYQIYFKYKIKLKLTQFFVTQLQYGQLGFQALESFRIRFKEIEALRRTIAFNHKETKIWFRIELAVPLFFKPISSRMGKGKGKLKAWTCNINKGSIFLELDCYSCGYQLKKIIRLLRLKMSISTRLVTRANTYTVK